MILIESSKFFLVECLGDTISSIKRSFHFGADLIFSKKNVVQRWHCVFSEQFIGETRIEDKYLYIFGSFKPSPR